MSAPEKTASTPTKKRYDKPTLVMYGPISKLTQGTKSVGNDGDGTQTKNMQCL